jgi:hypothetical protein
VLGERGEDGALLLFVFDGPHLYISPMWYKSVRGARRERVGRTERVKREGGEGGE